MKILFYSVSLTHSNIIMDITASLMCMQVMRCPGANPSDEELKEFIGSTLLTMTSIMSVLIRFNPENACKWRHWTT